MRRGTESKTGPGVWGRYQNKKCPLRVSGLRSFFRRRHPPLFGICTKPPIHYDTARFPQQTRRPGGGQRSPPRQVSLAIVYFMALRVSVRVGECFSSTEICTFATSGTYRQAPAQRSAYVGGERADGGAQMPYIFLYQDEWTAIRPRLVHTISSQRMNIGLEEKIILYASRFINNSTVETCPSTTTTRLETMNLVFTLPVYVYIQGVVLQSEGGRFESLYTNELMDEFVPAHHTDCNR
ncbi:hypothetical protein EVAR_41272_1 [Eumeta japonica]|uniref:Uncharacterized protein n=1 Tax=Eumeta variegata TaxID=151549 RepID=A0A4C1XA99_EUMVA|nr:hypothetical protein EVAR_41272_1 [Eumeta japonica]